MDYFYIELCVPLSRQSVEYGVYNYEFSGQSVPLFQQKSLFF